MIVLLFSFVSVSHFPTINKKVLLYRSLMENSFSLLPLREVSPQGQQWSTDCGGYHLLFAHHSDKSTLVIQYHFIVTPELTLNLEQPVNETHAGRGWRCNAHKARVQLTQRFEPAPEQLLAVHWFNTINIMHAYWFSSDSDHCVITKRLNLSWLCLGNSKDSVKLMERRWISAFSLLTKGHSGHNPDCSFPKIWKMKRKINVEDSSWFHYIAFPDKLLSKSMAGGLGWWYLIVKCRNS